jgi:NHLM bacteriocin system ABC transporter peptidase/ATP-binding protein
MRFFRGKRARVPTVLQMEMTECGPACLAMILAYYGRWEPLENLRTLCGVSRDGSKAGNLLRAARNFGLEASGYSVDLDGLPQLQPPCILFWAFSHFVVFEGIAPDGVWLNDPATGRVKVSNEEFDMRFTGLVLGFKPGPKFQRGGTKPAAFRSLRPYVLQSWPSLLFLLVATVLLAVPALLLPLLTTVFVDSILVGNRSDWLGPLLLVTGAATAAMAAVAYLRQSVQVKLASSVALATSTQFMWHVLRLPVEFFLQRHPADVVARARISEQVGEFLTNEIAGSLLLAGTYIALMFHYDWQLASVCLAAGLVNVTALRFMSVKQQDEQQRISSERGKLTSLTGGALFGIETIKACGYESSTFRSWAGLHARVTAASQRADLQARLTGVVAPAVTALNTALVLGVGGRRVMDGLLTVGMLIAFQSLAIAFLQPFSQLVAFTGKLRQIGADLTRLNDVLMNRIDPQLEAQPAGEPQIARLRGEIELRDVTFGYSPLEAPLIENLSLTIQRGARVALVGGSGSGKSTIAKLVAGLYQPWSGEILFDGIPRSEVPRHVLTSSIAMVDQELFFFSGTLLDNLRLWDETVPETAVIEGAYDACIHEDIAVRPNAYQETITEGARNFSGGQRQRLEIARALAMLPSILILDEATAALDPITEKMVDDNIRGRGCTSLIVAHRLSTIRDADEILVLDRGKVVQRGVHDELMAHDGLYRRLIQVH